MENTLHRLVRWAAVSSVALMPLLAWAHETTVGSLVVEHPYALPTGPGETVGAVYLRALRNEGQRADCLVGVASPVAQRAEIQGFDRAHPEVPPRPLPSVELPAGAAMRLRHDGRVRLALIGLERPLHEGERIPVTLRFEHAGECELTVWVQRPRPHVQP